MDIRIEAPSAGPNRSAPELLSLVYLQHFDICLWCIWGDSEISITKNVWTWMAPYWMIKCYGNIKTGGITYKYRHLSVCEKDRLLNIKCQTL